MLNTLFIVCREGEKKERAEGLILHFYLVLFTGSGYKRDLFFHVFLLFLSQYPSNVKKKKNCYLFHSLIIVTLDHIRFILLTVEMMNNIPNCNKANYNLNKIC